MSDKSPSDEIKDFVEMVDEAVEKHGELIDSVAESVGIHVGDIIGDDGGDDKREFEIEDLDRMREVYIYDDYVIVMIGDNMDGEFGVNVTLVDETLVVGYRDEEIRVDDVPDDLDVDETSVELNNGVLQVQIPRRDSGGDSVSIEGGEI